jgi:hypothetical protein
VRHAAAREKPLPCAARRATFIPQQRAAGRMPARKKTGTRRKKTLTTKQRAQRVYASRMRGVRARAKTARGGKGRIAKRPAARTMRKKLGLKGGR